MNLRAAWLLVPALAGCASGELSEAQRGVLRAQVDSATRAFQAAERARDAEGTVAHLAPDFYMYNDGVRAGYDDVVASIRTTMPALASFDTEWHDVEVQVLGPTSAVVTFTFEDRIVTAGGDTVRMRGPTTLVWRHRDGEWRISYADADHYPLEADGE